MEDKIIKPSDMLAWLYKKLDKRTNLPKGENFNTYRVNVEKLALKNEHSFENFKESFLDEYNSIQNHDLCLAAMEIISLYYKEEFNVEMFGLPSIKKGESLIPLNKLFSDEYLVYPQTDKVFIDLINKIIDGELREKTFSNPINKYLENHIIVKKTDLKDFGYKIITYKDLKYVNDLRKDKKLVFAFVPFIREKIKNYFEINEDTGKGFFEVKGVKNEEKGLELKQRYFKSLRRVLENSMKPEIILFPEMILTEEIVEEIPGFLKDIQLKHSALILAGTLWKNNRNIAYLFNHKGKLIAKQDKFFAFEYNKDDKYTIVEKIESNKQHILNILDVHGIGRIAVFICRDMKHHEYLSLLRLIDVDILLAPSYSKSNDVLSEVDNLAENNHTSVVFLNACSLKKDIVGKIVLPSKEKNQRTSKPINIRRNNCENCDDFCDGVVFKLDLKKEFGKKD